MALNIKMYIKELVSESMHWIQLV